MATKMTVAEYLTVQISSCGKSQQEIARDVGFEKPNIITMLKQGKSKLPISRVGKMAKALGVDPWYLYQLAMREYEPDTWGTIETEVLRGQPVLTENEKGILQLLRSCGVPNPKVRTQEERERLLSAFNRLRPDNASAE
jgi:transcriptional regulator with XRE-family HTH domain